MQDEDYQGSSVPSFSKKQIKKDFTTTIHCDDNEVFFLISRFRKNPDYGEEGPRSKRTFEDDHDGS